MKLLLSAFLLPVLVGCSSNPTDDPDAGPDGSADTDSDTDSDTDDQCAPWEPFDTAGCPDMSGWSECVVHVDGDATSGGDGRSWSTALSDLKDGLKIAACGAALTDICLSWQVWAAEGSYYAYRGSGWDTFCMRSNVALYGGFAGNEAELAERDLAGHVTILDGREGPDGEDRVMTVVTGYLADDIVLDGLTLQGGFSTFEQTWGGGCVFLQDASAEIYRCVFEDCQAVQGGAVSARDTTISITDSTFTGNVGAFGGGLHMMNCLALVDGCTFDSNASHLQEYDSRGGALIAYTTSLQIQDSSFTGNTASYRGGAFYVEESDVQVSGSTFSGNEGSVGGAAFNQLSHLTLEGCTFEDNATDLNAGALLAQHGTVVFNDCSFVGNTSADVGSVALAENQSVEIGGCLFAGNSSPLPGAALGTEKNEQISLSRCTFSGNISDGDGSTIEIQDEHLELTDSILWDECSPAISMQDGATAEVTYSDVRGGWAGEGNIDADPLFVDPDGGDYCLQAESPCIGAASDAGDMGYCPYEGK